MGNEIIEKDNLEVYVPNIGNSEDIDIDQTTTSYSKRLNEMKEGETIQVQLNEKAIKWRISHDLYKDYKSGGRELFNNEARACRQARDKYNAKPKIIIRLNDDTKDFSIEGIDSLGISESVFDNVLRVLGVSGNVDGGNEVGQFGMGFASYTTISDMITVETWYREARADGKEDRYAFLGDNGIDFKILPQPERQTFGTKVSMTYNSQVEARGLIDMISECAKFCRVPVQLIVENQWNDYHEYGNKGIYDLPVYESLEKCLDQSIEKFKTEHNIDIETDNHKNITKWTKTVHIDNDDYEFVGKIDFWGEANSTYVNRINGEMNYHLLAGVPIEIDFNAGGNWSCYALNIKNERKYMPTADRDRLTKEAEKIIQTIYDGEIMKYFTDYHLSTLTEYKKSNDKIFFDYISDWEAFINPTIYEKTREVLNTLNRRFAIGSRNRRTLREMLRSGSPVVCLKALKGDYMARINNVLENVQYFRWQTRENDYDDVIKLLKEAGVIMGEDYIKDNKLKSLTPHEKREGEKIVNADRQIRVWNAGYRTHHEVAGSRKWGQATSYGRAYKSETVGDVNSNVGKHMLVIDNKDQELFRVLKDRLFNTEAPYVLMKDIKGIDSKIKRYSKWVADNIKKDVMFVDGKTKSIKDLKDSNFKYIMANKEAIIKMVHGNKIPKEFVNCIVVNDYKELFEVDIALRSLKKFIISDYQCSTETLIEKTSGFDFAKTFYCRDTQKTLIYSKLPEYKTKLSEPLFEMLLTCIASDPYKFEDFLELVDKIE